MTIPSQTHWKKLPWRLNLLNGSQLYYKAITCEKNSAFCSVLQGNPAVASPKEQLYEQMTSNPAFSERNIQPIAYLLDSRQEQKSLVMYHTLQSLYACVWLVNTLTSTAPIGSPIICMWSPADICEQWERNLSFGSADVRGAGTCDEPLRTSAWEANLPLHYWSYYCFFCCCCCFSDGSVKFFCFQVLEHHIKTR